MATQDGTIESFLITDAPIHEVDWCIKPCLCVDLASGLLNYQKRDTRPCKRRASIEVSGLPQFIQF